MTEYVVRPAKGHQPWLTKPMPNRHEVIAGVMIHATRSGSPAPDYDDGPGTENWGNSPANKNRTGSYGSYWDELIWRDGTRVISTDWDHEYASWTAGYGDSGTWAAGIYYIQIEVSQASIAQSYSWDSIDSLAQSVAEKSVVYDFPLKCIPFLHQRGPRPRGICDHENSANGKKLRKSDVGPLFPWERFLKRAKHHRSLITGGEDMTEAEVIALLDRLAREGGFGDRGHVGAWQAMQAFNQRLKSHESLPKHGGAASVSHTHPTFGDDPDISTGPAEG